MVQIDKISLKEAVVYVLMNNSWGISQFACTIFVFLNLQSFLVDKLCNNPNEVKLTFMNLPFPFGVNEACERPPI